MITPPALRTVRLDARTACEIETAQSVGYALLLLSPFLMLAGWAYGTDLAFARCAANQRATPTPTSRRTAYRLWFRCIRGRCKRRDFRVKMAQRATAIRFPGA